MTEVEDDYSREDSFVTLSSYARPQPQGRNVLERMARDLWNKVRGSDSDASTLLEGYTPIGSSEQKKVSPPPAYASLKHDLTLRMNSWLSNPDAAETTRLIIYPPTDNARFMRDWARERDVILFDPPERKAFDTQVAERIAEVQREGVVVIPDLQRYFLRSVGHMDGIRRLLVAVCDTPYRVVLGCNSFGWQFLVKALDAQHLLPTATVSQAYNGEELRKWLHRSVRAGGYTVHGTDTGGDLFAEGNVGWFNRLSYLSYGIPWVAWAYWRRSLFVSPEGNPKQLWANMATPPAFPSNDARESLLVLHALLVHGGMTGDDLAEVLPLAGEGTAVAMLRRRGFVEDVDGRWCVTPFGYPSVRAQLALAGYPGDGL